MKPIYLLIALFAYGVVLVQVGVLSQWPPFGAEPHLIAIGATIFLVNGRTDLGLVWMVVGAGLVDLLLPVRFGITLVPLLIGYAGINVMLNRLVEAPSWLGCLALGLVLTFVTELPLMIVGQAYGRLWRDLLLALLVLMPLASLAVRPLRLHRLGLTIK